MAALEGGLHAFGHLDAEQCHGVLDGLGHVLRQYQTGDLLGVGVGTEDAVVVIELVEVLGELVAVVGDAGGL
jgi:hypothetical protein